MNFYHNSGISLSFPINRPIFGIFAFVVFACIASDGKTVGVGIGYSPIWNETWTDRLKRDLFLKYDKFARPTQHFNVTTVSIGMDILHVTVASFPYFKTQNNVQKLSVPIMDDFKSSMIVQATVKMEWTDEKLKWNQSDYAGLTRLNVGIHEVWQPDITLYNSVAGSSVEIFGDTHCMVSMNGNVFWAPPTQFHASCALDLSFWPFDTQKCYLILGSWMYLLDQIDLQFFNNGVWPQESHPYTDWNVLSIRKNRSVNTYSEEDFVTLRYYLTIKRQSSLYCATVLAPTATIVFLILAIFWLPPQSIEKIILCCSTALIICLFLIHFSYKIPPFYEKPPLVVSFYSGCLYLVTITLIISAFVVNLSRHPHCRPLPRWIKRLLVGRPGQYLILFDHVHSIDSQRPIGEQELRESRVNDGNTYNQSNSLSNCSDNGERDNIIVPTSDNAQSEWILAAMAVDRISFIVFSIIFAIMAMICLT